VSNAARKVGRQVGRPGKIEAKRQAHRAEVAKRKAAALLQGAEIAKAREFFRRKMWLSEQIGRGLLHLFYFAILGRPVVYPEDLRPEIRPFIHNRVA
jgi:hypothetical protein